MGIDNVSINLFKGLFKLFTDIPYLAYTINANRSLSSATTKQLSTLGLPDQMAL